jgi:pimeloyl-ACP methyl ester carboxylesterase
MLLVKRLVSLTLLALVSAPAAGQDATAVGTVDRLDHVDHAARMRRIQLTGDLGLPPLPPVLADSPRDSLLFSDRFPLNQDPSASGADGGTPTMFDGFLAMGPGGTGTDKNEIFKYQLGNSYSEFGTPHPMVVAYHGYGQSANSVALQTTIEEECNTRGWIYMAPTGIDDQLFGSPISQQNTEAAMQWMLDNFNIDADRIYMVGFSMGAGVVSNFTARRRDPDGMVIAALGLVSGTYDWTMSYVLGTPALQVLLENFYNFDGNPTDNPWRYQQASDLYFSLGSYPPLPGTLDPDNSMATNLGSTPVYHTWDSGDPLLESETQNPVLGNLLTSLGGTYMQVIKTGTIDPVTFLPAEHSWAVLDEVELFDFFDGKTANRTPADFSAQLDLPGSVAFVDFTQVTSEEFTYMDALVEPGLNEFDLVNVENANNMTADFTAGGMTTTDPIDLLLESDDADGFTLTLTNFAGQPAYLLDSGSGALLPGTESAPLTGSLIRTVEGNSTVDADLIQEPNWTTKLTTAPKTVAPGGSLIMTIDANPTAAVSLLLIGFSEMLNDVPGGNKVLVSLGSGTLLIDLPLDIGGDLVLPGSIPNNPLFSGVDVLLQTIDIDAGGQVDSISNMWVLHIQ